MKEKIVLVTGASSGIGKAAAKALANRGATIIIHGRDEGKLQKVKAEIIRDTNNHLIDAITADLCSQAAVRKMAATISEKYERLDVLVNNAGGMMGAARESTVDGIEQTIALNVLAPYLLTWSLLHHLKKSEDSRIITTASFMHWVARPDFMDIESVYGYAPLKAYSNAKLYTILMTEYFATVLEGHGCANVCINTVNPGAVATNFFNRNAGGLANWLGRASRPFLKSAAAGADTIVWLATSPAVKGISGKYFENKHEARVRKRYHTDENRMLVWNYCKQHSGQLLRSV